MKTYTITATYTISKNYKVEASSAESAIVKFKEQNLKPEIGGEASVFSLLRGDPSSEDSATITAISPEGITAHEEL